MTESATGEQSIKSGRKVYKGRSATEVQAEGHWYGFGLSQEGLPAALHDLSSRIDKAWETAMSAEVINDLFSLKLYRKVAEKIPRLAYNVQGAALKLVEGQNEGERKEGIKILLHAHLRTVIGLVDRFAKLGLDEEELLERGILTTIGVIRDYSPEKTEIPLNQKIHEVVQSSFQEVYADYLDVPVRWVRDDLIREIPNWMAEFHCQNDRLPTTGEIVQEFHLGSKKEVEYQLREGFLAVHQPSDRPVTILSEEEALRPAELAYINQTIEKVLSSLSPREQKVIRFRFGLGNAGAYTREEIAKEWKVSGERIRQIEVRALRKLRHPSRGRKLRGLY